MKILFIDIVHNTTQLQLCNYSMKLGIQWNVSLKKSPFHGKAHSWQRKPMNNSWKTFTSTASTVCCNWSVFFTLEDMWFQQIDATPHFSNETVRLLKEVISTNGSVNWPLRLCDLTQLGYFFYIEISSGEVRSMTTIHNQFLI